MGLKESNEIDGAVDHPRHYNMGNIEAIDMIDSAGWLPGFCAGNALKYLIRHEHKGKKIEDLKKAQWYLNRLIEKREEEESKTVCNKEEQEQEDKRDGKIIPPCQTPPIFPAWDWTKISCECLPPVYDTKGLTPNEIKDMTVSKFRAEER